MKQLECEERDMPTISMAEVRYKECRHCGNRVHPRTRQCPFCGEVIGAGWFSLVGTAMLVLVVLGLLTYAACNRTPSPGRATAVSFQLPE
ncbi:MAG TPA: hypothetical protein PL011_00935 [Kiritimatiellia bacterium]|nr:hypothetical protein [Kiritimatiellia bacterium]HPJ56388.1 hypothetical protein [Kiritimatiellia bacterium]